MTQGLRVQPQQREVAVVVTEEMSRSLLISGWIRKPRQKRKQGLEVNLKGHDYHRNLIEIPYSRKDLSLVTSAGFSLSPWRSSQHRQHGGGFSHCGGHE